MDWSVGLPDEVQQGVLAWLGTFVGGYSLEAAEVVVGEPLGLGIGDLDDSLPALADKSLARHLEGGDGEPRRRVGRRPGAAQTPLRRRGPL